MSQYKGEVMYGRKPAKPSKKKMPSRVKPKKKKY